MPTFDSWGPVLTPCLTVYAYVSDALVTH